jgi:quercetin dioxygenase-like cupin family protein
MKIKVMDFEEATHIARNLAEKKLALDESADEFVEIGNADDFKLYVTTGKTIKDAPISFHENPRDVFMLLFEGEMELVFEDGEKTNIRKGQYFVLPKHLKHYCVFKEMTVALEGVYEKGL